VLVRLGVADSLSVLVRFVVGLVEVLSLVCIVLGLVEFLSLVCIVLGDVPRHFVLRGGELIS
jgi:hypothetical protein